MTLRVALLCLAAGLVAGSESFAAEPDTANTRLLAQPAVSARHVAFVYGGDLWIAGVDGGDARRLTSDEGTESHPAFSPDGSMVAFSAEYDGNTDVFIVPVAGGIPVRLTWHPGADLVQSFTPDGKGVLFTSPRHVFTGRYTQLFTVPMAGGMVTQLPIPNASAASYSPDGNKIVYNPLAQSFLQWKRYRGGTNSVLYIYDVRTPRSRRSRSPRRAPTT